MKVLHISPTFFSDRSYIGGGERYACELASAMARTDEVVLLSFAAQAASEREGALRIEYLQRNRFRRGAPLSANPFGARFLRWVRWADVVHCYQVHTLSTDLATMLGSVFGKKVFITDLGGGHRYAPSSYLPVLRHATAFLLISEYSRQLWQRTSPKARADRLEVIYGGVDVAKFSPGAQSSSKTVLFVGRLLPHKGIEYLIDAIEGPLALNVVGRVYDEDYARLLRQRARGKQVTFHTAVGDEQLVRMYRESLVTVLPSVHEDCYGGRTPVPELLGLVALESMACGTPVIVTDVAAFPEIVDDGVTGFLVSPNNAPMIRQKIECLHGNPALAEQMGLRARDKIVRSFTWEAVVRRCLEAYGVAA